MTGHRSTRRDRFRDPWGWFLDVLPWQARRAYIAVKTRRRYRDVPESVRLIGFRKPSAHVIAYFKRLHREESQG